MEAYDLCLNMYRNNQLYTKMLSSLPLLEVTDHYEVVFILLKGKLSQVVKN